MVQGVGFRPFVYRIATDNGLDGWVRNEADGSVLCRAWGDAAAIEDFVQWCGEGPPLARVDRVVRRPLGEAPTAEAAGVPRGFRIRA